MVIDCHADIVCEEVRDPAISLAPAIEYSWTPKLGVLVGARVVVAGHGTSASYAPVVAINYVH